MPTSASTSGWFSGFLDELAWLASIMMRGGEAGFHRGRGGGFDALRVVVGGGAAAEDDVAVVVAGGGGDARRGRTW